MFLALYQTSAELLISARFAACSPLVAITHEELRGRTLAYVPNGKRNIGAIGELSRLGVRRPRAGQSAQNEAFDPEHGRGIKRQYKIRQRDALILNCKAVAVPLPALGSSASPIRSQQ